MHGLVICHLSFNHTAFDDRIYYKELLALQQQGYQTVHICVGEQAADFVTPEGIRIIQVQKQTFFKNLWLNRLVQLLRFKKSTLHTIFKQAAALQAAVYHYHDFQINALAYQLKQLPHQPKLVYDAHESYHLLFKENAPAHFFKKLIYNTYIALFKKWEIHHAAYCNYIVATDAYTLQYFQKKLPRVPVTIVYNYSYFTPTAAVLTTSKPYHFIYTGLLSKGRGLLEVIKAASLIQNKISNLKILLIGPFETNGFKEVVIKLIKELHLQQTIVIKEPVPFTDIGAFYQSSFVGLGLFHNTPKYATFIPIKLFEYMAFGLPVLFSNHGPAAHIIQQENCGLLVEPQDTAAIATAMKALLLNKEIYTRYSYNGLTAVTEKYNWQKEKEKLLLLYNRLLS